MVSFQIEPFLFQKYISVVKNVVRIIICVLLVCIPIVGNNLVYADNDYPVAPSPPFKMVTSHNIHSDYLSKFAPVPYKSGFVFGNANGQLQYMVGGNIWMEVLIDGTDINSSPIIVDSYAIIGTKVGTIAKVNIESGSIVWKNRVRNAIIGKPVYSDGMIYFGSADESFYCLNFDDGSVIFEYRTKTPIWSTPCIIAERVIFGGDDDKIYCLNKYSGNVLWEASCDGLLEAEPILDGFYLYVGSLNGFVYKINAITGEIVWNTAVPGVIHSRGVLADNFFVVADDSGTVSFIGKKDGRIVVQNSSFAPISAPLSTNGEAVYFVDRNKDFVGIDLTGEVIWKRRLINSVRGELLILDQKIYMLTSDGYLQTWEECGYVTILPENKNLGDFYTSDGYQSFDLEIVTGRDDGRVRPGAVLGRPFEAGKRCKAVLFRNTDVYYQGNRRVYKYTMTIDFSDPAFCYGENDFRVFVNTTEPIFRGEGEYEESGIDQMVFETFTFNILDWTDECVTCSPCYDIQVVPQDIPYFKRTEVGSFEIQIVSTDGVDRVIWLEHEGFGGISPEKTSIPQENGLATYRIEFDCMKLSGGSYFSIPIKVWCDTCPSPNEKMMEIWYSTRMLEFTTDPRIRIEMKPNSVDVLVNGEPIRLDVPSRIVEGRTLVPIRFVAETFGCDVFWEQETKKVTIEKDEKTLLYWAYKNYAEFNGERVEIDTYPIIERGRTLVPFRSIAESLGASVRWISSSRDIIIDWEF